MAAAAQQNLGQVQNQQSIPLPTWLDKVLFDDVPTSDGKLKLHKVHQWLHGLSRGGSSLGSNVDGTDPGTGGGGNAVIQAQHDDRDTASFHALLSTIDTGSQLYTTCSTAPFTTGRHIWNYLNSTSIVYLRPPDSEAQTHIRKVSSYTWQDMPPGQQNEKLCLNFKAFLTGHNPLMHPNMNIPRAALISIWCNGLHPEAKVLALELKDDMTFATQKGCVFPANFPVGHPSAGNGHPNAGMLSLDAMAIYVHNQFNIKLNAGTFRLKGQPAVNLASELPVPEQDAHDDYVSIDDAMSSGYVNFNDYIYFVMNRHPPSYLLRTCLRCGGINHMVSSCSTPEHSVSEDILRSIRYPVGVRPWIFKGKGKGKGGKGKGKGRVYSGKGKGHIMAAWQSGASDWDLVADTAAAAPSEPSTSTEAATEVSDDYDGWNSWDWQ
jgi:hypothetical protein